MRPRSCTPPLPPPPPPLPLFLLLLLLSPSPSSSFSFSFFPPPLLLLLLLLPLLARATRPQGSFVIGNFRVAQASVSKRGWVWNCWYKNFFKCTQIKLILERKALQSASFWKGEEFFEFGNGLYGLDFEFFSAIERCKTSHTVNVDFIVFLHMWFW